MTGQLPRISIVTPSFNQAPYIGWTVSSVFGQRYPDLEYIMMDGGSTDGTVEVLAPWRDRFAHYLSAPDGGQSAAIHDGLARATGEIMAYLNSDDLLAPGALHFVARFFADHPEIDALYSHRVTVDETNRVRWFWILPEHRDHLMLRWDMIPQETCFWRRRLFERAGNVDPEMKFAMDYDLFARYMRAGRFHRVDRFLGAFREHSQAKTSVLLDSVGRREIEEVWRRQGLRNRWLDGWRKRRLWYGTLRRGESYAAASPGEGMPGAVPGVGYDWNRVVWGGQL